MAELPSGTVTFLFTDIEGSTRLLARLRGRYVDVLAEHQRLLRAAVDVYDGREVHTEGDAFFVAFARATDAVAAAVAGQRALASASWPDGVDLRVRMGLHTGETAISVDDYVGLDVHRAARICSAGHGGQILVSGHTRELVADELPHDLHDPGFDLDDATAAPVAEICRRVDGLPLAIELAAARCAMLAPGDIAERLREALGALGTGPAMHPHASRRCARPSTGASSSSTEPSATPSPRSPSSPAAPR